MIGADDARRDRAGKGRGLEETLEELGFGESLCRTVRLHEGVADGQGHIIGDYS